MDFLQDEESISHHTDEDCTYAVDQHLGGATRTKRLLLLAHIPSVAVIKILKKYDSLAWQTSAVLQPRRVCSRQFRSYLIVAWREQVGLVVDVT